jgi:DNA repair protein RecN (Recombination protein N)
MLSLLHIENIAVIELSDITFDGRLNVLTGETGAGKSIIIDALSALLGQRASRDLIRTGHESALVCGVFTAHNGEETALRRELRSDGRNLCHIDEKPVALAVLRDTGDSLVNIHGQHDSQALLREETHIAYIDAFAGLTAERYTEHYQRRAALISERKSLSMAEDEKRARIDMLTYRLRELAELDLKEGEEEALTARRKTLRSAEQIKSALSSAYHALYGDEETRGACELTEEAADAVVNASRSSSEMEELAERLGDLQYSLRDCADEARSFIQSMEESEEELERLETRLDAISKLRRKHNMTISAVLTAALKWEEELKSLEFADKRLAEIDGEINKAETLLYQEAAILTKKRGAAARELEERMTRELEDLDMGKVRFSVEFEQTDPGENGCDRLRFLIAANVGEPLKPLSRIASGGEMARIMLSIKNLLAQADEVSSLVFDEVDSGVSGQAAQRVAQKLCAVSRRKQVLCVTHLPQIAAFADSHFRVEKKVAGGRTVTRVVKLDHAGRIDELAKITAGASVTEAARKAAAEMLEQAEVCKREIANKNA